jgi:TolA-binding protein
MEKYNIASLNKRLSHLDIAEKKFTRLCQRLDRSPKPRHLRLLAGAYFHLGEIYRETNKKEQAKDMFLKTLGKNPCHRKAKEYLGQ